MTRAKSTIIYAKVLVELQQDYPEDFEEINENEDGKIIPLEELDEFLKESSFTFEQ